MIKGIIFDIDGTLFSYDTANAVALQDAFEYMTFKFENIIDSADLVKNYKTVQRECKQGNNNALKHNKFLYFKKLFDLLNLPLTDVCDVVTIYNDSFCNNLIVYNGVFGFLKMLSENNIALCALSNNICSDQLARLANCDILSKFSKVFTSDELGEEKPNNGVFLHCINELGIHPSEICFVGDKFDHDIAPALNLKMLACHHNEKYDGQLRLNDKYIEFNDYDELRAYFDNLFKATNDFEYLSKIFGQSVNYVQGGGGNISIKLNSNELLMVKASGTVLGNVTKSSGYCLLNNKQIKNNLEQNVHTSSEIQALRDSHVFKNGTGSIESFFHSMFKKYVVHLHLSIANLLLTSSDEFELVDFKYNGYICKYLTPGKELSQYLHDEINNKNIDVVFLKNHGVIITADTINELEIIFTYVHEYLISKIHEDYRTMFQVDVMSFQANKIYKEVYDKNVVIYFSNLLNVNLFLNTEMTYCFPDLAVFAKTNVLNTSLELLRDNLIKYKSAYDCEPDLIIIDEMPFVVGNTISKCRDIEQILHTYGLYKTYNKSKLTCVDNAEFLQNWESEKYRQDN